VFSKIEAARGTQKSTIHLMIHSQKWQLLTWMCMTLLVMLEGPIGAADNYGDPNMPVAGSVLGTTIHTKDVEELRYVVLGRLLEVFAKEKSIAVTEDELTAYQQALDKGMHEDRLKKETTRDVLKRQLAATDLPKSERETIAKELKVVERFLADTKPDQSPQSTEDKQARKQIASAFIKQWKLNGALFTQYGGRIGFQQGGPEPLDATRKFLEERKLHGDFTIASKELEDAFWGYYLSDTIHRFYESGSKEEAQAFTMPPWTLKSGATQ
jgi:hypothetical protein